MQRKPTRTLHQHLLLEKPDQKNANILRREEAKHTAQMLSVPLGPHTHLKHNNLGGPKLWLDYGPKRFRYAEEAASHILEKLQLAARLFLGVPPPD